MVDYRRCIEFAVKCNLALSIEVEAELKHEMLDFEVPVTWPGFGWRRSSTQETSDEGSIEHLNDYLAKILYRVVSGKDLAHGQRRLTSFARTA